MQLVQPARARPPSPGRLIRSPSPTPQNSARSPGRTAKRGSHTATPPASVTQPRPRNKRWASLPENLLPSQRRKSPVLLGVPYARLGRRLTPDARSFAPEMQPSVPRLILPHPPRGRKDTYVWDPRLSEAHLILPTNTPPPTHLATPSRRFKESGDQWVNFLNSCATIRPVSTPDHFHPRQGYDEWTQLCLEKEPNYAQIAELLEPMKLREELQPKRVLEPNDSEAGTSAPSSSSAAHDLSSADGFAVDATRRPPDAAGFPKEKSALLEQELPAAPKRRRKPRQWSPEEEARRRELIEEIRVAMREEIYEEVHKYLEQERDKTAELEQDNIKLEIKIKQAQKELQSAQATVDSAKKDLEAKNERIAEVNATRQPAQLQERRRRYSLTQPVALRTPSPESEELSPSKRPAFNGCCQTYCDLLRSNLKNVRDHRQCLEVENQYRMESWRWLAEKYEAEQKAKGRAAQALPKDLGEKFKPGTYNQIANSSGLLKYKKDYYNAREILRVQEETFMAIMDHDKFGCKGSPMSPFAGPASPVNM